MIIFPKLISDTKLQIQSSENANRINWKKRKNKLFLSISFKLQNLKDKKYWKQREENTYRGGKIRIISKISLETMQTRREWREIFKYWGWAGGTTILCAGKISLKEKNKDFLRKKKNEKVYCQWVSLARNVKIRHSKRRKIM